MATNGPISLMITAIQTILASGLLVYKLYVKLTSLINHTNTKPSLKWRSK